jgi:hypothetical protein
MSWSVLFALGTGPIQPSTGAGARRELDPRDKPEDDNWNVSVTEIQRATVVREERI